MATSEEFAYIDWIRERVKAHPRLALGIGDDAAIFEFPQDSNCLIATDLLMEGVHFTIPPAMAGDVGRKVLAVNLSDIAAMAGKPLAAVVSVALSRNRDAEFARELHIGLQELADEFGVAIAGGDTNTWDGPVVVSLTLLGEAGSGGAVRRDGAQVGDWILVTGSLGGSLAGRHVSFQPRVAEAQRLHEAVPLHAMIDVSDGFAADLHHILKESGVGAVLNADSIPISEAAGNRNDGKSPLEHALGDGEDFELLFTVSPEDGRRLLDAPMIDVPLTHIGEIVADKICQMTDSTGKTSPLDPRGWRHSFS